MRPRVDDDQPRPARRPRAAGMHTGVVVAVTDGRADARPFEGGRLAGRQVHMALVQWAGVQPVGEQDAGQPWPPTWRPWSSLNANLISDARALWATMQPPVPAAPPVRGVRRSPRLEEQSGTSAGGAGSDAGGASEEYRAVDGTALQCGGQGDGARATRGLDDTDVVEAEDDDDERAAGLDEADGAGGHVSDSGRVSGPADGGAAGDGRRAEEDGDDGLRAGTSTAHGGSGEEGGGSSSRRRGRDEDAGQGEDGRGARRQRVSDEAEAAAARQHAGQWAAVLAESSDDDDDADGRAYAARARSRSRSRGHDDGRDAGMHGAGARDDADVRAAERRGSRRYARTAADVVWSEEAELWRMGY